MTAELQNDSGPPPLKNGEWRLPVVMAERGIRTATELHRMLTPYGIDISSHRISRIVAKMPDRLNMQVLIGLMTVLECSASDLIREAPASSAAMRPSESADAVQEKPSPRALGQAAQRARAEEAKPGGPVSSAVAAMLGTRVTPIPVKPRSER